LPWRWLVLRSEGADGGEEHDGASGSVPARGAQCILHRL